MQEPVSFENGTAWWWPTTTDDDPVPDHPPVYLGEITEQTTWTEQEKPMKREFADAFRNLARVYRNPVTWAIAAGSMLAGIATTFAVNTLL